MSAGVHRRPAPRSRLRSWAFLGACVLGLGALQFGLASGASAADGARLATPVTSDATAKAKTVRATCPAGRAAVGATATLRGTTAGVHLDQIVPRRGSVTVHASPSAPGTDTWSLTATAICVPDTPDIEYVAGPAVTGSRSSDDDLRYGNVTGATCRAGKELIGLGGRATGGRLNHLQPIGPGVPYTNDTSGSSLIHGVEVLGSPYVGGAATATVQAYAVCADAGHGTTVQNTERTVTTTTSQQTARCPAGTQLHAIGFVAFYPNHYADLTPFSYALLTGLAATSTTGLYTVRMAKHADTVAAENWHLVNQSLCATG